MTDPASGPPTKTILSPDGIPIHYPNLPNVGEPYNKRDSTSHDVPGRQSAPPTQSHAAAPPASANESWRERVTSAARSAVDRVGLYGHAAVQALVLDDWKALTDAHSSRLQRVQGGADLASWAIPEGKVAEIAAHAAVKASEIVAAHLTASGFEHAGAAAAALAASRGISRPLTEAERSGHFQSANDFKKFMGPAGPERDWHHIVEKMDADDTRQFPPERVHSIGNMAPVPRGAHQGAGGLSAEFSAKDEFLGTSLRERLRGQPWEKHVDNGEQALRDRGFDPDALRGETRARFDQRLLEHDRPRAIANEHGFSKIAAPGLLLGLPGASTQAPNHAAPGRAPQWSPDMPLEDFAKLQAQIRGGSARDGARGIPYERDGVTKTLPAGLRLEGNIQRVEGDHIVQHLGRGHTATCSREELSHHFNDPKVFDAMMQPGNYVKIGMGNNGIVDAQQRLPDHSWQSLNGQPTPSLGHGHGR